MNIKKSSKWLKLKKILRFRIKILAGKQYTVKIQTIADKKSSKSLSRFEIKQPDCPMFFIFVFQLSFIDCILSKIVGFDQLWTIVQQKLVAANGKLVFFKMFDTFCRFIGQSCRYFLRSKKYKSIGFLQIST